MSGPLKSYQWPTSRSYEYITGTSETAGVIHEFCSWCTPGAVFYDVGSNIGYYSFIANTLITTGKIYAFEPVPFNNDLFKQLLLVNKKKMLHNNIEWYDFAIADRKKEVDFSINTVWPEGNTYVAGAQAFDAEKIKVQCYSIDELLQKDFAPPSVIKIDVEGAEYDVLTGAAYTLKKYMPNILLATHNCIVPGIKGKCVAFLEELGYVLTHTGYQNKSMPGLDDYIAVHKSKLLTNDKLQTI